MIDQKTKEFIDELISKHEQLVSMMKRINKEFDCEYSRGSIDSLKSVKEFMNND